MSNEPQVLNITLAEVQVGDVISVAGRLEDHPNLCGRRVLDAGQFTGYDSYTLSLSGSAGFCAWPDCPMVVVRYI